MVIFIIISLLHFGIMVVKINRNPLGKIFGGLAINYKFLYHQHFVLYGSCYNVPYSGRVWRGKVW